MLDYSELLAMAGLTEDASYFDILESFAALGTLPLTEADRRKRSALFMLTLQNTLETPDPESTFRDTLRDLMHASVDFGINWTDEERMGWQDVRGERSRLKPNPPQPCVDGGEIWIEGPTD